METSHGPRLIAGEHILPRDGGVPSPQDILVDAGQAVAEGQGPPLAVADYLELHAPADGLGDAERAAEGLHLEVLLRGLPVLEAGLERVRRGGLAVGGVVGALAHAVAECVVDARRGGRGGGLCGVGEGLGVGGGGDDAQRLEKRSCVSDCPREEGNWTLKGRGWDVPSWAKSSGTLLGGRLLVKRCEFSDGTANR